MTGDIACNIQTFRLAKQQFRKMLMNRLRPGCNEAKVINRALIEANLEITIGQMPGVATATIQIQSVEVNCGEEHHIQGAASQETLIRWIKATFLVEDNPEAEHFQNVKLIAELCTPEERSIILDKYRINDLVELKPETARALARRTKERRGEAQ